MSPAVMAFGTSNTSWNRIPLPIDLGILGAPGCAMRTNNLLSLGVTTTVLGGASITLPIPINTALIDFDYYTQFTVLDPTANAFGLVTTRGIRTTVGGRR
jgi:hypothetical protein